MSDNPPSPGVPIWERPEDLASIDPTSAPPAAPSNVPPAFPPPPPGYSAPKYRVEDPAQSGSSPDFVPPQPVLPSVPPSYVSSARPDPVFEEATPTVYRQVDHKPESTLLLGVSVAGLVLYWAVTIFYLVNPPKSPYAEYGMEYETQSSFNPITSLLATVLMAGLVAMIYWGRVRADKGFPAVLHATAVFVACSVLPATVVLIFMEGALLLTAVKNPAFITAQFGYFALLTLLTVFFVFFSIRLVRLVKRSFPRVHTGRFEQLHAASPEHSAVPKASLITIGTALGLFLAFVGISVLFLVFSSNSLSGMNLTFKMFSYTYIYTLSAIPAATIAAFVLFILAIRRKPVWFNIGMAYSAIGMIVFSFLFFVLPITIYAATAGLSGLSALSSLSDPYSSTPDYGSDTDYGSDSTGDDTFSAPEAQSEYVLAEAADTVLEGWSALGYEYPAEGLEWALASQFRTPPAVDPAQGSYKPDTSSETEYPISVSVTADALKSVPRDEMNTIVAAVAISNDAGCIVIPYGTQSWTDLSAKPGYIAGPGASCVPAG